MVKGQSSKVKGQRSKIITTSELIKIFPIHMFYKEALPDYFPLRQKIVIRIAIVFLLVIWISGFSFIQIFPVSKLTATYPLIKQTYSLVCHQDENKSFIINDIHLFVCARCTGIYIGAFITAFIFLFLYTRITIQLKLFLLSLAPMVIDIILYSSGVYKYSKIIAFGTGIFSGSVVFIYILNMIEKHISELRTNE